MNLLSIRFFNAGGQYTGESPFDKSVFNLDIEKAERLSLPYKMVFCFKTKQIVEYEIYEDGHDRHYRAYRNHWYYFQFVDDVTTKQQYIFFFRDRFFYHHYQVMDLIDQVVDG